MRLGFILSVLILLITQPAHADEGFGGENAPFDYGHKGKFLLQPSAGVNNIVQPVLNLGIGYAPDDATQFILEAGGIVPIPENMLVGGEMIKNKFGDERRITNSLIANYIIRPEYDLKLILGVGGGMVIERNWEIKTELNRQYLVFEEGITEIVFISAAVMYEVSRSAGLFCEMRMGLIKTDIFFPILLGAQMRF
ncbi:MAG: hypothetical protein Kow0090_00320 [Myxococcota bacterium]